MGAGLLLPMAFVLAVLAARGDERKPWAPIAATVTVAAQSRDLPPEIAELVIEVKELAPLPLRDLVGRVADLAGVRASVEERPGRVLGGDVARKDPVSFGLSMTEAVPAVLDEVARLSGYDWGWEDGRLLFYRYADVEQRRPERIPGGVAVEVLAAVASDEMASSAVIEEVPMSAVAEGLPEASPETGENVDAEDRRAQVPGEPGAVDAALPVEGQAEVPEEPWEVSPDTHATVEDVLRSWAERAGWQLAWKSERQYEVGAAAAFPAGETEEAGFLAAADALLAIGPMRRALSATAYPNRWLVVTDVGSAAQ
ncbi:MAG: TcpQ domain-containing protein [Alphaproteobacteria bacterium]|nr:TcpQ domain-containing protein [Alphaproteobacteria bacterium]